MYVPQCVIFECACMIPGVFFFFFCSWQTSMTVCSCVPLRPHRDVPFHVRTIPRPAARWVKSPEASAQMSGWCRVLKRVVINVIWHRWVLHTWANVLGSTCFLIKHIKKEHILFKGMIRDHKKNAFITQMNNIFVLLISYCEFYCSVFSIKASLINVTQSWYETQCARSPFPSWKGQKTKSYILGVFWHFSCICSFCGLYNCCHTHSVYLKIFERVARKGESTLGETMAYLQWLPPCLITRWFVTFSGKDASCYCPSPAL